MTDKRFNPERAHVLMRAERKELLPPDKIIEHLHVNREDMVADLGAGNGYFTIPIAKRTDKLVYAVDIEPKMLEMLSTRAGEEQLNHIKYVESDLENIQLEDNAVNKIMTAFVIHEVSNIDKALSEIKRILKPGGQVLFIEWEAIETESGPPLHERIPSDELAKILGKNGFSVEVMSLNPVNYGVKAVPV